MDIPDEYKTDHLFLLVGSNPLPNWVAAKLLLKEGGALHLIHSEDTLKVAERLREHLQGRVYLLQVDPAVAQDIERKIKSQVSKVNGTVGLHYTGGTKAMAVHAYRAVEQTWQDSISQPVFSYLDADNFRLRIDPGWQESVLLLVEPSLEHLTNLHGSYFQKGLPKREESLVLLKTSESLAASAPDGLPVWRDWCNNVLRAQAHTDRGWKRKSELKSLILKLPSSLPSVTATLKQELGLNTDDSLPLNPSELNWPFKKRDPKYLCRWLDGEWLEQYVLAQIIGVADELKLHDWAMNIKTESPPISDFDFEFDVATMRGYQLFGISCTTDTQKNLAKSKLFEAYIRARQLGGDEARVGLVCGYAKAQHFEREVVQEWQAKDKIKVFGPYELPDLSRHLADWFMTTH